jgi:hypothetical protein
MTATLCCPWNNRRTVGAWLFKKNETDKPGIMKRRPGIIAPIFFVLIVKRSYPERKRIKDAKPWGKRIN